MFLFYLGSSYCFLFCPKSVRKATRTKVMQKLWCSKLLKYFNKKGQIIRHFLLLLVPYIRFLFESLKVIREFSSRFDWILWCSKLLKYFNKKGQIIRPFLLLLVPYIRFLFESLKLIKQFSSRFYQISVCSNVLKYFNIFQKVLPSSNFFLFTSLFLIFLPCTKVEGRKLLFI